MAHEEEENYKMDNPWTTDGEKHHNVTNRDSSSAGGAANENGHEAPEDDAVGNILPKAATRSQSAPSGKNAESVAGSSGEDREEFQSSPREPDQSHLGAEAKHIEQRDPAPAHIKDESTIKLHRVDRSAQPYTQSLAKSFPLVEWIAAKEASKEYYLVQAKACNAFSTHPAEHWTMTTKVPKCRTCIEKVAGGGRCRFQGIRAFRPLRSDTRDEVMHAGGIKEDESGEDSQTGNDGKAGRKRKHEETASINEDQDLGNRSKRIKRMVSQQKPGATTKNSIQKGNINGQVNRARLPKNFQSALKGFKSQEQPILEEWVLGQDNPDNHQQHPEHWHNHFNGARDGPQLQAAEYLLWMTAPAMKGIMSRILKYVQKGSPQAETGAVSSLKSAPLLFRIPEPGERIVCDACGGACFICSWMCVACGNEICMDCWEGWNPPPSPLELTKGEEPPIFTPRYDRCANRKRHARAQFVLICRSSLLSIKKLHEDASDIAAERARSKSPPLKNGSVQYSDAIGTHHLPVPKSFNQSEGFDNHQFRSIWHSDGNPLKGTPLLLQGMLKRFKKAWTPEHFIRNHGAETCFLVDCATGETHASPTTVGEFFKGFMTQTIKGKQCSVKLKDWPPNADFADHFPNLFEDFEQALPFPEHMSRKGILNLASYFDDEMVKPDLGPKMYCAYPAPQFLNNCSENNPERATTNLHLDVTDAINIMVYASPISSLPKDSGTADKPAAIWDIFEPRSTPTLNRFLRQKYNARGIDDPINRQLFFLTDADLETLDSEQWSFTKSFRIYQEPGDAVLIPAGCAHQVANGRSCIKVAVDFVSSERLHVCADIMKSFRDLAANYDYQENHDGTGLGQPKRSKVTGKKQDSLSKKEDVLQLYNSLMFSWRKLEEVTSRMRSQIEDGSWHGLGYLGS